MDVTHRRCRRFRAAGVIVAAGIGLAAGGCGGEKIESVRLDREIAVDGTAAEWDGALVHLEEKPVSIGVMNDDEYLYLCLMTDDPTLVRQAVMQGLTIGFRGDGRKEEDSFRVLFPVGGRKGPPSPRDRSSDGARSSWNAELPDSIFVEAIREVTFEGPNGRGSRRWKVAESHAVVIAAGRTGETFVYELRVPLEGDDLQPCAVGVSCGGKFTLTLSMPEPDVSAMGEPTSGRGGGVPRGGGGGPGGGMGGRGGGGMGRRGAHPPMPEPFDVRFEVSLSEGP